MQTIPDKLKHDTSIKLEALRHDARTNAQDCDKCAGLQRSKGVVNPMNARRWRRRHAESWRLHHDDQLLQLRGCGRVHDSLQAKGWNRAREG